MYISFNLYLYNRENNCYDNDYYQFITMSNYTVGYIDNITIFGYII